MFKERWSVTVDSVHIKPGHAGSRQWNNTVSARFNTALVNDGTGSSMGIKGKLNINDWVFYFYLYNK